jgi:hypothetical protein
VRGDAGTPVLHSMRSGGDTGIALHRAVLHGTRLGRGTRTALCRAVLRSMCRYNSSLIWLWRPYSVQISTVRGVAPTLVLHGTRLGEDTGTALRREEVTNTGPYHYHTVPLLQSERQQP